ncbi:MAG: hypothetical protein COA78_02695 [Blastopirellula sp.]|nr:MAG: hypothetical protein COA78_02695 [Blastopirellula sp.]
MNLVLFEKSRTWADAIKLHTQDIDLHFSECRSLDQCQAEIAQCSQSLVLLAIGVDDSAEKVIAVLELAAKLAVSQLDVSVVLLLPREHNDWVSTAWETGANYVQQGQRDLSGLMGVIRLFQTKTNQTETQPADLKQSILQKLPW